MSSLILLELNSQVSSFVDFLNKALCFPLFLFTSVLMTIAKTKIFWFLYSISFARVLLSKAHRRLPFL
jgi:hypothetical protein